MAVQLSDKLDALTSFLEETIKAAEPPDTLYVEKQWTNAADPPTARAERSDKMGDPVHWLHVVYAGPYEATVPLVQGESPGHHRFRVTYMYDYASISNDEFLSYTGDSGGIISEVNATPQIGSGFTRCSLKRAEGDTIDVVALDTTNQEAAHICTFEVDVEG